MGIETVARFDRGVEKAKSTDGALVAGHEDGLYPAGTTDWFDNPGPSIDENDVMEPRLL